MSEGHPETLFSPTYREARRRFLEGCERAGASMESLRHPAEGPDGLPVFMDCAFLGAERPERLLVLVSATHGPEGHCGSACQLQWLGAGAPRPEAVSVLLIHGHNPHGFAWGIRHTHERVDLNRNFVDHAAVPSNALAAEFFDRLGDARDMAAAEYIQRFVTLRSDFEKRYGVSEVNVWLGFGQYRHEQGLHFGGFGPTWSREALTEALRRHGAAARHVVSIDFHTGLGRYGYGELLSLDPVDSDRFRRSREIFGGSVFSMPDGRSAASYSAGNLSGAVHDILPDADVTAHALEFGTFEGPELLELKLRYHHRLVRGELEFDAAAELRNSYRALFFPERLDWMEMVVSRSRMVVRQALDWLAMAP